MRRFGLSKRERIKSKKEISLIYSEGTTIFSKRRQLKVTFYKEENSDFSGVKVAFAVSKKSGVAVWRNRVKRLMRESYRLNKESLTSKCISQNKLLLVIFSLNTINQDKHKIIFLRDIRPEIIELIEQIKSSI